MLREFGGNGRCGARGAADADGPVGLAEPLGVELTDHTQNAFVEQAPVATGDGLLGGPEHFGQAAERRSRVDVKSMDDPSVQ